jgi:GNAT superfamily N-acetyltransferase
MLRQALPDDANRLAELSTVLGYPVSAVAMRQRLTRLLGRDGELVLVAGQSGSVVGWVHGSEHELLESGRRCEILGLVVDQEHRRQGIGRQLILAVEQWARERGILQVAVRSNVQRTVSHEFYQRLGYQPAKTQHAYRKSLERIDR